MWGRGKGGKGLGKGGAKRHRKVLRNNIQGITKPAVSRRYEPRGRPRARIEASRGAGAARRVASAACAASRAGGRADWYGGGASAAVATGWRMDSLGLSLRCRWCSFADPPPGSPWRCQAHLRPDLRGDARRPQGLGLSICGNFLNSLQAELVVSLVEQTAGAKRPRAHCRLRPAASLAYSGREQRHGIQAPRAAPHGSLTPLAASRQSGTACRGRGQRH
jgi:hypothetical protein